MSPDLRMFQARRLVIGLDAPVLALAERLVAALERLAERPAAAPAGREDDRWTAERNALLAELWPVATDNAEVLARINALPGVPVENENILRIYAERRLGLRRSAEVRRAALRACSARARARKAEEGTLVWTDARREMGARLYRDGDERLAIVAALNRLDGEPITPSALKNAVVRYGWKREVAPPRPARVPAVAAPVVAEAVAVPAAAPAPVVAPVVAPVPIRPAPTLLGAKPPPSRQGYDWAGEWEDAETGAVLCDWARVAAYAARYDIRFNGDMRLVNQHREANGRKRMTLCEPHLLPEGAAYPVAERAA